ncbi:hypothetical protein CANARDRAFT_27972, partial [[Candida] arabinofermentans NRRL YB-2248]
MIRNDNVLICPVFALAISLFYRYEVMKEEEPDFENKSWRETVLFPPKNMKSKMTVMSPAAIAHNYREILKFAGKNRKFSANTHLGRKSGATMAVYKGVSRSEIERQGGWSNRIVDNYYYCHTWDTRSWCDWLGNTWLTL